MKLFKFILIAFAILLLTTSCGASRVVSRDTDTELVAIGVGESASQSMARDLAYQDVNSQLSVKIEAFVQTEMNVETMQTSKYNGAGRKRDNLTSTAISRTTTTSDNQLSGVSYVIKERRRRNIWHTKITGTVNRNDIAKFYRK